MTDQVTTMEKPCFDPKELRNVFGQFATGVTVITTVAQDGTPIGLAANSFSSISLEPALVSWSLSLNAPSLSAFRHHGHFAINFLSEDSMDLAQNFSRPSDDKFAAVDWTPGVKGLPTLDRASAVLECHTISQIEGGDHEIYIGNVLKFTTGPEKPPLLFFKGKFAKLGDAL
ncbi:flavin reductase family protein [Pacificibacter sp. AS14]|uniref:flavin reductase family protein n=1 Tax=Pacificibacter sp. AS14 TaxID=3135785 RepID=UPI00316DB893